MRLGGYALEGKAAGPTSDRLRTYGLTREAFDRMLEEQGGRCAVCRERFKREAQGRDGIRIDHRHDNGAVRGLLCATCNRDVVVMDYPASRRAALMAYAARGRN